MHHKLKKKFKTVFKPCTEDWGDIGTNQGYIPFDQSESEFFDRKLDFFIPFHHNPILDCSPNNLPLEADRSDWYLKLVLDCSFHLINGFIDRILNCLITWTADQKSQGNLDRENRSAFGRILCSSWSTIWSKFRLKNPDSDWSNGMHPKFDPKLEEKLAVSQMCPCRMWDAMLEFCKESCILLLKRFTSTE